MSEKIETVKWEREECKKIMACVLCVTEWWNIGIKNIWVWNDVSDPMNQIVHKNAREMREGERSAHHMKMMEWERRQVQ